MVIPTAIHPQPMEAAVQDSAPITVVHEAAPSVEAPSEADVRVAEAVQAADEDAIRP